MKHRNRVLPLLFLALPLVPASEASARNLSGCWDATGVNEVDKGFCYFTQVTDVTGKTRLFWNCKQVGQPQVQYVNLAFGTIHADDTICVHWANDLEGESGATGGGVLTLKIDSDDQVSFVSSMGPYFGTRLWKKRPSCP